MGDLSSSTSPLSLDKDQGLSDVTKVPRGKGDSLTGKMLHEDERDENGYFSLANDAVPCKGQSFFTIVSLEHYGLLVKL